MTRRQRVETTYALEKADRIPFVPAVYEHKARLIGRSPSEVCRDEELLHAALMAELETYGPDMLTVGIDVYNVEAEALGCRVAWFDDTNDVPAVTAPLLESPAGLGRLGLPDPESDGRMPMLLRTAGRVHREVGRDLIVRGALTGPFSMASELLGAEALLIASIEDPAFARRLVEFAAQVTVRFGAAFAARGVEPIVFDSRATPKLSSPRVFRELIAPVYRDIVSPGLKAAGARWFPLIVGGDTTAVVDDLIATGATQLLCDHNASLETFLRKTAAARVSFRANVDPRLIHSGPPSAIRQAALRILEAARDHPGFLFGCGVVAYDCDPSHVHALRWALEDVMAGGVDFDRELREAGA